MNRRKKTGATRKLEGLTNINCSYGTEDMVDCKAIWLEIGSWITILEGTPHEGIKSKMEEYRRNLNHYIRAHACSVHPDYLYSLIDLTWSEGIRFKYYKSQVFLELEITLLFKQPLASFKKNLQLGLNMEALVKKIEHKMTSPDWLVLTQKRRKKVKEAALSV